MFNHIFSKEAMNKQFLKSLPSSPGVYIFYQKNNPIYIGKATNLRARIMTHLRAAELNQKESLIIKNATKIDYQKTVSDFQAILLEAKLISYYQPKYNQRGRDNKSFLYIEISNETYPKVALVRKTDQRTDNRYFGPFQNQKIGRTLIGYLRKIFPFCTQKKISKRPCFYSKIGLCFPCPNEIEKIVDLKLKRLMIKKYRANIKGLIELLEGKTEAITKKLYQQINYLTRKKQYEKAILIRNRLFFLNNLTQGKFFADEERDFFSPQEALNDLLMILKKYFPRIKRLSRIEAVDISNYQLDQPVGSLIVYQNGVPDKSSYRRFKIKFCQSLSDIERIQELFLRRFSHSWPTPDLLIVDGGRPQVEAVMKVLIQLKKNIPLIGIAKMPDRLIIGSPNFPLIKPSLSQPGFNLVRQIRDESHRFAKKYHLLLRSKNLLV